MTRENDDTVLEPVLQLLVQHGFDGAAEALETLLNAAMRLERSLALKAEPYARSGERQGYANGFKPKTVRTRLGQLDLLIPQVRDGISFYPSALERGERSERALKLAIAEMYVKGVSTRTMGQVMEQLCGTDITSAQVSRAAQEMDAELEKWRSRPLGNIRYLLLDARYEKVRVGGAVRSCAVLIAAGVDGNGKRTVLGVSISLSEAEVHWREFLASLQRRGLCGIQLAVSDDHAGLKAALTAVMPSVPWQRCQFHLQQNAQQFASSRAMRAEIGADLRAIFAAQSRTEAEERLRSVIRKYRSRSPKFAEWLETNVVESLTVFALPAEHRRRLRTSNLLERINKEIKRRTRVATLFPNEASVLRLVSAVLAEISEDWESGDRVYLTPLPIEDGHRSA